MRAKRILVRAGIIACGVILFGMIFRGSHLLLTRRSSVVGEREQNGWMFVRRFSGEPRPIENTNALVAFIQRAFGRSEEQTNTNWLEYPSLWLLVPQEDGRLDGDLSKADLTAHVVSSTGDRFLLGVAGDQFTQGSVNATNADTYARDAYLRLPGCPPAYQWLDVTVADKKGHQATWRVFDLPHLIHHDLGPIRADTQKPVPGITLDARAYWVAKGDLAPPNVWAGLQDSWLPVKTELRLRNQTPASDASDVSPPWMFEDTKLRQEWERPEDPVMHNLETFSEGSSVSGSAMSLEHMVGFAAPYPGVQRTVAIDTTLAEHKTTTETVTFHNLRVSHMGAGWSLDPGAPGVARSPSGITVRVVPVEARQPDAKPLSTYTIDKDRIYYRFTIDQRGDNVVLPASPLYRRYHCPIKVSGSLGWNDDFQEYETWSSSQIEGAFGLKAIPANHILPTLKFTVMQDAKVRTMPIHFVLPVTEGVPTTAWKYPDAPAAPGTGCGCAKK